MEKELGLPCKEEFPALRDAFQQAFYDPQTHLYRDSESSSHASLHANAIPAYAGIVPEEGRETIAAFLKEKELCCGVYMAWFVLKGLCCLGHWEDAYQLIVSTGEHSWYNMVREGGHTPVLKPGARSRSGTPAFAILGPAAPFQCSWRTSWGCIPMAAGGRVTPQKTCGWNCGAGEADPCCKIKNRPETLLNLRFRAFSLQI